MRFFTAATRFIFWTMLTILAWSIGYTWAQSPQPAPPAPSCEQQLHDAQRVILQLRKANAQSEFQNVTLQERILQLETAPKAAAAPAPARPAAAEKGK